MNKKTRYLIQYLRKKEWINWHDFKSLKEALRVKGYLKTACYEEDHLLIPCTPFTNVRIKKITTTTTVIKE